MTMQTLYEDAQFLRQRGDTAPHERKCESCRKAWKYSELYETGKAIVVASAAAGQRLNG